MAARSLVPPAHCGRGWFTHTSRVSQLFRSPGTPANPRAETSLMKFGLFGAATAQRTIDPDVDSAAGFKDYIDYVIEADFSAMKACSSSNIISPGFGQCPGDPESADLDWRQDIHDPAGDGGDRAALAQSGVCWPSRRRRRSVVRWAAGFRCWQGLPPQRVRDLSDPDGGSPGAFEEAIDIITKSWVSTSGSSSGQVLGSSMTSWWSRRPSSARIRRSGRAPGHAELIRGWRHEATILLDQFASIDETVSGSAFIAPR